MLLGNVPL